MCLSCCHSPHSQYYCTYKKTGYCIYHLLQLTHTNETFQRIMYMWCVYMCLLSVSVSPHWLSQEPSQLEEELSQEEKKWSLVSQSVDMVVGGCPLNCTQPLLLLSPEAIVFLTVVASMSAVKLVLFSGDLLLSSYLHGVDM